MKIRQWIFSLSLSATIAALVACSPLAKPTILQPISVALASAPTLLSANATTAFKATVTNDSANAGVTWSVTCGDPNGACGTFNDPKATATTYTAPAAIPPGKTVTITAASKTDTSRTASATITIESIFVKLDGALFSLQTLLTSATASLTAGVTGDSANAGVTWSLTCGDTSAGACGALSNTTSIAATYSAPGAIPIGKTVTVTATSVTDATKFATTVITITVISVKFSGIPSSLSTNTTASLMATVNNDPKGQGVNWSCLPAGACGTFNPTTTASAAPTTYTAPAALPTGNVVTITATSVSDSSVSASATIKITLISVTLSGAPSSLSTNATTQSLAATVTNDPAGAGVTWSVTCGSAGACGSFSSTTTSTATYTAPAAVPIGGSVTLTATSITDTTKSASAIVTITPPPLADGTYVFSLAGINANNGGVPYHLAGAFVVSGGSIAGGEQDYVDDSVLYLEDQIASGTQTATADGNLQIILTTCNGTDCTNTDGSVGVGGIETINGALISATSAQIIEFDPGLSSSGRLDLQTSTAAPSAGYAFFTSGLDSSFSPIAIGGVINVNGSGTISGKGSIFDINDAGTVLQKQSFAASTVSAPDNFGRVVFTLNPSVASGIPSMNLAGYIADATHIRLVETTGDSFAGSMGGAALSQGTNTGTFSSITGNSYVAGLTGMDVGAGPLQAAGVFTMNSGGKVGGFINYNDFTGGPLTPSPITGGTYTLDSTGRVTLTGVTDGINPNPFTLQIYLTGNGQTNEETVVSMDNNDVLAGLSWQQTGGGSFTASSFSGNYVLDATGVDLFGSEFDAVGPISANGVGTLTGTGTVDLNSLSLGQQFAALTVSGTFAADPSGAFTGTATGLDITQIGNGVTSGYQDVFAYYLIDTTKVVAIETDTNQLTLGLYILEP